MKLLNSLFVFAALLFFAGCKKEKYAETNKPNGPLTIKASKAALLLKEKDGAGDALEFTWTTGNNQGTDAAIAYTLQLAKQGTNFTNPISENMGTATYSRKFIAKALNDSLLNHFNATPGVEFILEARILAKTSDSKVADETSPVITVKITPFQPVSKTLFLIGDATPNGWDNTKATPLTAANEPGVFTWTGLLTAGEFKFLTTLGEWLPTYNKSATSAESLFYRTDFSQPDDKFIITSMGTYTVKVDLINLTIAVAAPTNPTVPPYDRLWIVGDATPNGWNINAPNEMRVDSGNLFVFDYNEILAAGEFKIPTSTGNWDCDYYMPLINYQDLTADGVQLVTGGSPDNKWKITTPGAYKIKLDLYNTRITIKPFTPFQNLWLVGDATPVGWNIDNPTPMTVDPGNPYIFTWEGPMTAGEFKIPTTTGNWGCDYFMPMTNHQSLTSKLAKFVPAGNPDNKWQITLPGTYRITLNQLKETINIVKL